MRKVIKLISTKNLILNTYLFENLLPSFIFSLIICSILAELIGISFEQVRFITERELPLVASIYIHYLKLPSCIAIALPYAVLFSTCFAYSQISRNSEIIALQSFGISLYRLVLPALILGVLASTMMFSLNELIVPSANYKAAMALEKHMNVDRSILAKYNKKNIIYKEYSNKLKNSEKNRSLKLLLLAQSFDGEKISDVIVLDFRNHEQREAINTHFAQWDSRQEKWKLIRGTRKVIKYNSSMVDECFHIRLTNNIPKNFWHYINFNRDHREMYLWELYYKLKIIKKTNDIKQILQIKMDIFRRYTNPCSCFIFALLGSSAGISRQVRENSISKRLYLVIATLLSYYILSFFVNYLCLSETIPISWGIWIPNVITTSTLILVLIHKNKPLNMSLCFVNNVR